MKAIIGVCDTHDHAVEAVKLLEDDHFPMNEVSIIGKVDNVEDHLHVKSLDTAKNAPMVVGTVTGTVVGLLTGLGVFAIPGFGFLYGAGAVIGTIAGFDMGLVGGGIVTLLATMGIEKDQALSYDKHVKNGRFLLMVQGPAEDVKLARDILHNEQGVLFD